MVCCPLPNHDDTSPSMRLDLERDRYRCYGCSAHGDVVQWVQDIEGVTPTEAIRILDSDRPIAGRLTHPNARSSWQVPERERPDLNRTSAPRVTAANALAWRYYSCGSLHEYGLAYLLDRGMAVTALETEVGGPVVGHTPSAKTRIDGLVTWLRAKEFSEEEVVDGGLAIRNLDGSIIDFFRDRAILPIKDERHHVVGLLGRDVTDRSKVKYLNQPSTHSYDKSVALYRPSQPTLHDHASVVVCEGPLDALAIAAQAATAGVSPYFAPIAACGRAISDHQIDHILAVHPRPRRPRRRR